MELQIRSVKSALPVFVRFLRDGTEHTTLAYVDYAFDTVEVPDPQVFWGIDDEQVIEKFKRDILNSMDYDPGNIPVQAVPQIAFAEIAKVKKGEYRSIFQTQNQGFGPGVNNEEETDGV